MGDNLEPHRQGAEALGAAVAGWAGEGTVPSRNARLGQRAPALVPRCLGWAAAGGTAKVSESCEAVEEQPWG